MTDELKQAAQRLLNEAVRANETALEHIGVGLIDLNAIAALEDAITTSTPVQAGEVYEPNAKLMELADRISPETDWYEFDQVTWCNEAAALLRQQAERIAELQSAHAIAVEIAAQYAAERDQLREEAERLRGDAGRYRYLRDRSPREVLCNNGPSAGCWIDCEDEHSELILLTGDDADAAIDAARTTHKETE